MTPKTTKFPELSKLCKFADEQNKKLRIEGEKLIKKALTQFLADFPEVETVQWDQYAPYFNDGDACVFGLYGVYITYKETEASEQTEEDHDEYDDDNLERVDSWDLTEGPLRNALSELQGHLESLINVLEEIWGTDATVIVTRNEITVEECSHE